MNETFRTVTLTDEAHLVESFWRQPGAELGVHMNTLVLRSAEPVVFDTGVAADRAAWLDAISSLVEPGDVRWIVLSHDDHDHVGNLEAALLAFPAATVVASWWMGERLAGNVHLPLDRLRWVVSGETLDIGDRNLVFERPPLYDSPATRAVFDPTTGLYWGGDLGGAPGPAAVTFAEDWDADLLGESFLVAQRWNSPWFALVDRDAYQREVTRLDRLGITTWAHTHGPVFRRGQIRRAIDLLRAVPDAPAAPQPDQAALDAVVAGALAA